ncbi:MAG: multicopper oxidase family protein [Burkholderiales bacterium]
MTNTRRRFLAGTAAAIAGAAGIVLWRRTEPPQPPLPPDPSFPNALNVPTEEGLYGVLDAAGSFTLVSAAITHAIVPGKPTRMLGYTVEQGGRTFLNPILRVATGASVRIRYWNALDETSIVHWHGLKVDTNNDGHPHYAVGAGETYDYQFTVTNRAGTYWYHPHPHHLAGKQAYHGLAGFLLVEDDEELALRKELDLALGTTDIPLLIQDKRLGDDGSLVYAPGGQEHFHGHLGDTMLVNLTPAPCFDCQSRLYRFRLVNGSNARIYRLAFVRNGEAIEFALIGSDGGLLERPLAVREIFLSPSERADVLLDLRASGVGERIVLSSLPFDAMTFNAHTKGAAHASHDPVPNGAPLEIMLIRVAARTRYDKVVPTRLSSIPPLEEPRDRRVFTLDHSKGVWRINRRTYRMTETAFSVQRGAKEVWEFRNPAPGMPHPVHVHGFQYRVLERMNSPPQVKQLASGERGVLPAESGWKDSVLLWPEETIRLAMDFSHPHQGDQVYMLQCHNMEHEMHGMMVNFRVAG